MILQSCMFVKALLGLCSRVKRGICPSHLADVYTNVKMLKLLFFRHLFKVGVSGQVYDLVVTEFAHVFDFTVAMIGVYDDYVK